MALKVQYRKKLNKVMMRSGYLYTFRYRAYENDPSPTAIFLNSFSGTHPNTKRQWRFLQMLNLTYVPRSKRKSFAKDWIKTLKKTNNVKLTYEKVKNKYPFLKLAIRRYFYSPSYYITNLKEIPLAHMEKVVISTYSKSFYKKVLREFLIRYAKIMKKRRGFLRRGSFKKK